MIFCTFFFKGEVVAVEQKVYRKIHIVENISKGDQESK